MNFKFNEIFLLMCQFCSISTNNTNEFMPKPFSCIPAGRDRSVLT